MDEASSGELSFSEVSTWSMPELFTGRAKDGRRIINQQAKQALIARLRVSPGSMVQASQANGIRRELLQRWVSGKTYSQHKFKVKVAHAAAKKPAELIPVRIVEPGKVVQPGAFECELTLPKGTLRIKCNAESIGALIGQLQ